MKKYLFILIISLFGCSKKFVPDKKLKVYNFPGGPSIGYYDTLILTGTKWTGDLEAGPGVIRTGAYPNYTFTVDSAWKAKADTFPPYKCFDLLQWKTEWTKYRHNH